MIAAAPSFDRAAIEAHVSLIHDLAAGLDGILILAAFEAGGPAQVQRFRIGDVDGMVRAIMGFEDHPSVNLYAPWSVFRRDLEPGKKGSEADVVVVLAAVPDLDNDKYTLGKLPVEAPYVVESSPGNFQPVYIFDKPLAPAAAKPVLAALSDFIGGDSGTKDCSHVWRIPGTLNIPTKPKLARGRSPVPAPVRIKKTFDGLFVSPAALLALAPTPRRPNGHDAAPSGSLTYAEERRLRNALAVIPAEDRDTWLKVGAALHLVGARATWDDWSKTSTKFDAADQDRVWASFHAERKEGVVTIATLFAWAKERGWVSSVNAHDGQAKTKHFELIPFGAIKFDGGDEWLVKRLLPRCGVGAFFGAKSAFKSFAAQDLALHIACGWNWAGRRVTQAPVIYIAAEGSGGFRKRKAGFELHHAEHLPQAVPFHLIAAAPNLGQGTADREALSECVTAAGVSPGLIVVDTVAQTLGSAEENGAGMIQLIANAQALSHRFSCAVLLVHHAGLTETERLRGHSSLGCALDALVFFEPREAALAARLMVQKLKEEVDRNVSFDLELLRVVIGKDCDGDEISTLVVDTVREGKPAEPAPKERSLAKMMRDEFEQVYDFLADGKPPTVGLDGHSRVLKVSVKEIREEMKNRGAFDTNDNGELTAASRSNFSRACFANVSRKTFARRGDLIWRTSGTNKPTKPMS